MKNIKLNFKLKGKNFKRITPKLNKINVINLYKIMQTLKDAELDFTSKKFIFEWENATTKFVKINDESRLYMWLFPIPFSSLLAIILEIFQNNINYMTNDREKIFESICILLKIEKNYFYKLIEKIQRLLIDFGKVKICENGKVVIMYDVQ